MRALVLAAFGCLPAAHAQNLITNGNFASVGTLNSANSQITAGSPSNLPGWNSTIVGANGGIACVMIGVSSPSQSTPICGTTYATRPTAPYPYGTLWVFPGAAPVGGNVMAADGSALYEQSISQTLANLKIGSSYLLTFYQAAGQQAGWDGATTNQWEVSFLASGACASYTPAPAVSNCQSSTLMSVPNHGSAGWASQTMIFTASSTTETLTFLASGGPGTFPPFALLADVNLTAIPEPAAFSVFSFCVAGLAGLRLVRRRGLI